MATLLLQAAGAYLGGFLGATGVTIGTAAGALAGYALDRYVLGGTRTREGPRLKGAQPFSAEDGTPVPRLYGTARLGGTLIWATRFEETRTSERQGGKGGPRVNSYTYFANAAFALCEGEIATVRRVWADGRELDLTAVTMRLHRGSEDQPPDPLIEAKQGAGNAPAYRGIAYVVFERLPLEAYGNRLPQLQFEVIRPVGPLCGQVRAVALIPGSTQFGYAPGEVSQSVQVGEAGLVNRHVLYAASDFEASIDELVATCPNLTNVALVATWFGNDLRAGQCRIRPGVTDPSVAAASVPWEAGGLGPAEADIVSQDAGRAAYGGTPSDLSVIQAIGALKARGLKVTLYPFIMMDVPAGNTLPDPYGGSAQARYPWRGRITCDPAPGRPQSADKTAAARGQADLFMGAATAADFSIEDGMARYAGDPQDWGYRRFVLHYAMLAQAAGGVDAFLIGSELRGLTTLRDQTGAFPAVEALCDLAAQARVIVGAPTKISYGADWSEYFGHQPTDGSGDVHFHLDPLWAHPAIDAIGIDNYLPLADWRDGDHAGTSPDGAAGPYDAKALRAAIAGGERFDWHYVSDTARRMRQRSAITDDAYGKPWVFRPKDIVSWWSNPHHDRPGGVEAATPTAFVPRSKPIWFTELGCPACDKGPNQPNVFVDPKSAESALPYFSNGGRSDLAQHRFLRAHLDHWDETVAGFVETDNPVSGAYGGRMVDRERIYLWAWDARPFPVFPMARHIWGDGGNWPLGHWLNGRLANPTVADLVNAVLADHGLPLADTTDAGGTLVGYVVAQPSTARAVLEELADIYGLAVIEEAGALAVRDIETVAGPVVAVTDLVWRDPEPAIAHRRAPPHDLPGEVMLAFRDPMRDYQAATARHLRPDAGSNSQEALSFSGSLEAGPARSLALDWLRRQWRARETVTFAVPASDRAIAAGSLVSLAQAGVGGEYLVTGIEEGLVRQVEARRMERVPNTPDIPAAEDSPARLPDPVTAPFAVFMDLPLTIATDEPHRQFQLAAWSRPWRAQRVFASPEETGFDERADLDRPAVTGALLTDLAAGPVGRIDRANALRVQLRGGALASVSTIQMLNGANAAAIRADNGVWEVVQFETAVETAANVWQLDGLLRGQLGTEDAMVAGASAGAPFVVLDAAVRPAGLRAREIGLPLHWMIGPAGADFGGPAFSTAHLGGGLRAAMPLAPVHIAARLQPGGDVTISWIRRGRIAADSWEPAEIPLGEEEEAYRVEIRRPEGALVRAAEVTVPHWTYPAADILADFAATPAEADIVVMQKKRIAGAPGLQAVLRTAIG